MDRICIDILGPFPTTERGNKYILVAGDCFTRWVEAYALPDQTASTVANVMVYQFFARLGLPLELHSDQGRNFESQLFKEMCLLLDINKTRTSGYHPISNGFIERYNYTLVNLISAYVDDDQHEWDMHLPLLTAAYRTCVHDATGYTPNLLMLGREVNAPIDLMFGPIIDPDFELPSTYSDYVCELSNRMSRIYELTRENLAKSGIRQKRDYDTRLSQTNYNVGDLVYYLDSTRKIGKSPKLNPHKWIGPCVITKRFSDLLFEICFKLKGKRKILHHNRLKPYRSDDVPEWVTNLQRKCKEELISSQGKVSNHEHKKQSTSTTKDERTLRRSSRPRQQPKYFGIS